LIKINKHIESSGRNSDVAIDVAAQKLWGFLTPKLKNNQHANRSVLTKAKKLNDLVSSGSYARKNPGTYKRHRNLINYLNNETVLRNIVFAKPDDFKTIIGQIHEYVLPSDIYNKKVDSYYLTEFGRLLLDKIFDYDAYRSSDVLLEVYSELNFESATCSYCNADTISVIKARGKSGNERYALFDLDHFYPKSKYPYLALSFYNHIPSCSHCNGRLKKSRDFTIETHIHPYHRCFSEVYKFNVNPEAISQGLLKTLEIKPENGEVDLTVTDLKLNQRYERLIDASSSAEIVNFLHKYNKYFRLQTPDETKKEMLLDFLKTHLHPEANHLLKKPFGKLKRDLVELFDIDSIFLKH
jgi:hypothetical protein